jgi:hypothetical protein
MAVEVAGGRYRFLSRGAKGKKVAFYFNPLHDLESICWLLVWSLFHYIPEECQDEDTIMKQAGAKRLLCFDSSTRMSCVVDETAFYDIMQSELHPALHPLAKNVDKLFEMLRDSYKSAERVIPISGTAFDTVHKKVLDFKDELVQSAKLLDGVKLISLTEARYRRIDASKRKTEEEEKERRTRQRLDAQASNN